MKQKILLCIAALVWQLPLVALAQAPATEMRMMSQGAKQEAFIAQFAQQAKEKDVAAILKEMDTSAFKALGEKAITQWLQTQLIPFFQNYSKLHTYTKITNTVLPDGRVGLWHYSFIVDTDGKILPFSIAVIDTPDGPRILNGTVNECIKDRHPAIAACPASAMNTQQRQPAPQNRQISSEELAERTTKKLAAIDGISAVCASVNPDANATANAMRMHEYFPQGEPADAESIRQSTLYKETFEKVREKMAKDATPSICARM